MNFICRAEQDFVSLILKKPQVNIGNVAKYLSGLVLQAHRYDSSVISTATLWHP